MVSTVIPDFWANSSIRHRDWSTGLLHGVPALTATTLRAYTHNVVAPGVSVHSDLVDRSSGIEVADEQRRSDDACDRNSGGWHPDRGEASGAFVAGLAVGMGPHPRSVTQR